MPYDVVTLGETMIRLSPSGFNRMETSESLEMHVGGSESNTAVGLARLGRRVAWLSRLTANPLGKMIAGKIAAHGVDVSHVVWTEEDRVGTYYLERGCPPRSTQVIYDRKNSAISRMNPEHLPTALFRSHQAKLFHTTGITVGISETAAATAMQAAELAKSCGWKFSFDLNFRSKLWSADECRYASSRFIELADIAFMPLGDAKSVFEISADSPEQVSESLVHLFPNAAIVLTLGVHGSCARTSNGDFFLQPSFPLIEVDRLGGGDAFSAGFLHAFLDEKSLDECLKWGNAVAALKYTIPGDLPLIDVSQIVAILAGNRCLGIDR